MQTLLLYEIRTSAWVTYLITIFLDVVFKLYSLARFSGQNLSMAVPVWSGKLEFQIAIEAFQVRQSNTERIGYSPFRYSCADVSYHACNPPPKYLIRSLLSDEVF